MQPTLVKQITTTGHLPGKITKMGIQAKDMPHIMGMLTNMYSDSVMAVLREYSANARDEHLLLGITRPIEVTLPSRVNSDLIIKDYGRGMSVDFVENRYSQYGDSAKRDDPNQIGGFGVGGKAALAYTDSFTLITVHNGVKGMFVISRDSSGAGNILTLPGSGSFTNESNYTEVRVPAKDVDDFTEKAKFLFKFWPEGSVLVNGMAPERHSGIPMGEGLWYSQDAGQSYVVMGGIPYRVANPSRFLSNTFGRFHFIAEIGMEEATITPDREDLEYDEHTLKRLTRVGQEFEKRFIDMAKKDILSQPDHQTAYAKWVEWKQKVSGSFEGMSYKGDPFVDNIPVDGINWKRHTYRYENNYLPIQSVAIGMLPRYVFLKGRPGEPSSYTKARVRRYLEEKTIQGITNVVIVDKFPSTVWAKANNITWDDVLTVKPPAVQRVTGIYTIINERGYEQDVTADELKDWESKLVLITPKQWRGIRSQSNMMSALTMLGADVTLVKLAETRWPKFKRTFNEVHEFTPWITDFIAVSMAEVPQSTWELRSIGSTGRWIMRKLRADQVDDPELKKIMAVEKNDQHEKIISNLNNLAAYAGVSSPQNKVAGSDWLSDAYPLIDSINYYNIDVDELALYMNAAYAARKDK